MGFDVAPADLAQRYYEADETLLEQRGCQRYEAPVRYADGSFRDIEFHKAVFFKPDGGVGGQVGVMLDVTERNQLMHKLEKFSHTDPLTGTGNRREFDAVAHRELRRHRSKRTKKKKRVKKMRNQSKIRTNKTKKKIK